MTTKELKCADLVDDRMKDREQQIKELLSNPDSDDLYDPALSVDTVKVTTICLSWGGPSDYLKVKHVGLEIHKVTYEYYDWFDGATREVLEDSPLYEYAAYILESDSANYE